MQFKHDEITNYDIFLLHVMGEGCVTTVENVEVVQRNGEM